MKALVIYYSYTGHVGRLAKALAKEMGADIVEVRDKKRPGKLKAYTLGCFASMGMKAWPVEPAAYALDAYDKLVVMAPVWAGKLAPAINGVWDGIPAGKEVEVRAVSASGTSRGKDGVLLRLAGKNCRSISYMDVKAPRG